MLVPGRGVLIIMSSSSDDLALKLEWYEIRDFLLGDNERKKEYEASSRAGIHLPTPAHWLTDVCWEGRENAGGCERCFSCSTKMMLTASSGRSKKEREALVTRVRWKD